MLQRRQFPTTKPILIYLPAEYIPTLHALTPQAKYEKNPLYLTATNSLTTEFLVIADTPDAPLSALSDLFQVYQFDYHIPCSNSDQLCFVACQDDRTTQCVNERIVSDRLFSPFCFHQLVSVPFLYISNSPSKNRHIKLYCWLVKFSLVHDSVLLICLVVLLWIFLLRIWYRWIITILLKRLHSASW